MTTWTTIDINLNALTNNFSVVKALAPNKKVIAMIKANAYGHGLLPVAKALNDADALGVARLETAKQLRKAGVSQRIVLFGGCITLDVLKKAADLCCDIVVHHPFQIELIKQVSTSVRFSVFLKIDTGMGRLGFQPEQFLSAYKKLKVLPQVSDVIVMTHFSDADDPKKAKTLEQINGFNKLTQSLDCEKSLANSAGILAFPESHADWVRPGIMLYGASPLVNKTGADHGLQPVMTVRSKVISVKHFQKGQTVGYSSTFVCPESMPIGVIGIGYGDGYPRVLAEGAKVLIGGKLCDIVGRVSMDMITVDLRKAADVNVNDDVVLWGEGLPAEWLAREANTIAYELFCSMAPRSSY